MTKDYEVGYGRPPKETRFRKGQSGNPRGRPKESKNAGTVLARVLQEGVDIRANGRTRRVTWTEAMIKGLLAKAAQGHVPAVKVLLDLIERHGWLERQEVTPEMKQRAADEFFRLYDSLAAADARRLAGRKTDPDDAPAT